MRISNKVKKIIKLLITGTLIICCLHIYTGQTQSRPPSIDPHLKSIDSKVSDSNVKTQTNYSFNYTFFPKHACDNNLYIVVCVISHVNNFNLRKQWRKSMRSISLTNLPSQIDSPGYKIVFLVAEGSPEDLKTKESLQKEHMDHGDIIQPGFQEHYQNLVFKSLAMLDWFDRTCHGAQFLLKIDDDVFLNLPKVVQIVQTTQRQNMKSFNNLLLGKNAPDVRVHRNKTDKWYVPETVYNKTMYPAYVFGAAYIMSKMAVHQIRSQCAEITPFNIEDVIVTGICRDRAGITPTYNDRFCIYYYKMKTIPTQCVTFHSRGVKRP